MTQSYRSADTAIPTAPADAMTSWVTPGPRTARFTTARTAGVMAIPRGHSAKCRTQPLFSPLWKAPDRGGRRSRESQRITVGAVDALRFVVVHAVANGVAVALRHGLRLSVHAGRPRHRQADDDDRSALSFVALRLQGLDLQTRAAQRDGPPGEILSGVGLAGPVDHQADGLGLLAGIDRAPAPRDRARRNRQHRACDAHGGEAHGAPHSSCTPQSPAQPSPIRYRAADANPTSDRDQGISIEISSVALSRAWSRMSRAGSGIPSPIR